MLDQTIERRRPQARATDLRCANDRFERLLAVISPAGLSLWCRHCKQAHLIPRERVIELMTDPA